MSTDNERFRNMLQANPAAAVTYLYDMYYESLFRYACLITKDQECAKDIVQEAILHVWSNRKHLTSHPKSIEHYLMRIVRNKSLSYFRKAPHLDISTIRHTAQPGDHANAEVTIIETEILQQIRKVISTFPTKEQEYLLLKIDNGMSLDEIASIKNVTRKAVEGRITSALKRLRKWASDNKFP